MKGFVNIFLRVALAVGSVLQLPCCPCRARGTLRNLFTKPLLNLPPHAVDKLKANMEYDDAEAYEVSVDLLVCCKGPLRNVLVSHGS